MPALFVKKITVFCLVSACLFPCLCVVAYAQPESIELGEAEKNTKKPGQYRTFLAYFENDLFADTDQYYTNAVKLTWLTKDLREYRQALPEWLTLATWLAPPASQPPDDGQPSTLYNIAFSLGQDIYTPDNIESSTLLEEDRPYAGWLYGGLALWPTFLNVPQNDRLVFSVQRLATKGYQRFAIWGKTHTGYWVDVHRQRLGERLEAGRIP